MNPRSFPASKPLELPAWRFGRGWSEAELRAYLGLLRDRPVNFETPPEEMTTEHGWLVDGNHRLVHHEPPGPPVADGIFMRARAGLMNYDFSDPTIVMGHFDAKEPFVGRDMLLEIKVLGFRFLNGVRVHSVREVRNDAQTVFGFRYDTLLGHVEKGFEWFLLTKDHATGAVHFQIEAHWRPGEFPHWWMKVGFFGLASYYRHLWRERAPGRLRALSEQPAIAATAAPGKLAHRGSPVPERTHGAR